MLKWLLLFSLALVNQTIYLAQTPSIAQEPSVRLEYVVPQELRSAALGSFVVKNNYPSRSLDTHIMQWELSSDGGVIHAGTYSLEGIQSGITKYIGLTKLFDLKILEELDQGLVSLYAEIQDTSGSSHPVRIVGESVILAEAEHIFSTDGEPYQVIKVAGARIYRIANGNSVTIDPYGQIVGLDLGEGNVLAGPIRPVVNFNPHHTLDSSSIVYQAQNSIDRNGPMDISIDKASLQGIISYDIDGTMWFMVLFALNEAGLTLSMELYGTTASTIPELMSLDIPMRQLGDTLTYFGHEKPASSQVIFGDTRLGYQFVQLDSIESNDRVNHTYTGVRVLKTPRGNIKGENFSFSILPSQSNNMLPTGITRHDMDAEVKLLLLERELIRPRKPSGTEPNRSAYSAGFWQVTPKTIRG